MLEDDTPEVVAVAVFVEEAVTIVAITVLDEDVLGCGVVDSDDMVVVATLVVEDNEVNEAVIGRALAAAPDARSVSDTWTAMRTRKSIAIPNIVAHTHGRERLLRVGNQVDRVCRSGRVGKCVGTANAQYRRYGLAQSELRTGHAV